MIDYIKNLIQKDDPLIIEIGCWNGKDTLRFLNQFVKCKIYGFEPDPRNITKIKNMINDNRFELIEKAISNNNDFITFYESHGKANNDVDWSASGSLNKPKEHLKINPNITFGSGIKVASEKLDDFIIRKQINKIDLIWADVNGAEKKLIEGATESLKITKYFYTEFSDKEIYEDSIDKNKILKLLPNFKEIMVYQNNVLMENTKLYI